MENDGQPTNPAGAQPDPATPTPYQPPQPTFQPGVIRPDTQSIAPAATTPPVQPLPTFPTQSPSYPSTPMPVASGKSNRKLIMILGAVLVVAVIAGSLFFVLKPDDKKPAGSTDKTAATTSTDAQVDTQESLKAQNLEGSMNETVNLSNGLALTVTGVEHNWTKQVTRNVPEPAAGNEYIAVSIKGKNNGTESLGFGGDGFMVVTSAGEEIPAESVAYQVDGTAIGLMRAEPGEEVSGQAIFEVPKSDKKLSLKYSKEYENTATGEQIELVATIKLY